MSQFYLLSIVSIFLSGFVLSGDYLGAKVPALGTFRAWLENRGAALALGRLTAVIGFLKFFVRAPNDTVPVAGDLLPAIAGLAVGATLFFEALLRKPSTPAGAAQQERPVDRYAKAVLTYRIPLGIVCVAIALLHFLFPQAVIL
jgi:hypothetical protein